MKRWRVAVLFLMACGTSSSGPPSSSGPVTVTMLDPLADGAPAAGRPVVFVDHGQTTVVQTDASGVATAELGDGGSVTGVFPTHGVETDVQTVLDVSPGDELTLGYKPIAPAALSPFTLNFSPSSDPQAQYGAYMQCGTNLHYTGTTISASVDDNCANPMEVMLTASDAYALIGYVDALVQHSSGGSAMIDAPNQPPIQVAVALSGIPQDMTFLAADRLSGGVQSDITRLPAPSPSENLMFTGPVGQSGQLNVDLEQQMGSNSSSMVIYQNIDPSATAVQLDVGAAMLPWMGPPSFDLATMTLHVPTIETGGLTPDLFFATVVYESNTLPGINWTVVAPKPGVITLPTLPADVGDLAPKSGAMAFITYMFEIELDIVDGYAAARQSADSFYRYYQQPFGRATLGYAAGIRGP